MANDEAKNAGPVAHEHPYPPTMTPYPQGFSATYPGYPAVYFAQPPDTNHGEGASGAASAPPLMIPIAAPGMLYPYPPGQRMLRFPHPHVFAALTSDSSLSTVYPACITCGKWTTHEAQASQDGGKTLANTKTDCDPLLKCTNCANACKRCNEARPCERCIKYGIPESCVDGVRKERQKGIKRGPYKRKNKTADGEASFEGTVFFSRSINVYSHGA